MEKNPLNQIRKKPDYFEYKKVQEVKGSFYVYLPKTWCDKYNLKVQRRVMMRQLDDDSLLIHSENNKNIDNAPKELELDLDPNEKMKDLTETQFIEYTFNQFLTAYIIGVKKIVFKKSSRIPLALRKRIASMTRTFHGLVINSESENSVIIEDTSPTMDIHMLMKQILAKVGIVFNNFIELIENEEYDQIDELINQDDQIDEYRYAIEREVHLIMQYPSIAVQYNTNSIECLHISECAKIIERIGDYINKMAKLLKEEQIKDKKLVLFHLRAAYHDAFCVLQDYFMRSDAYAFYELIEKNDNLTEAINCKLENNPEDKDYLLHIRRIVRLTADLAEIRINNVMSIQIA
jgi:phosphate uptake regulator